MPVTANSDKRIRKHGITLVPLATDRYHVIARHSRGSKNLIVSLPRAEIVSRIVAVLDECGDLPSRQKAQRVCEALR